MLSHLHNKGFFPYVKVELPVHHFLPIASCPVPGHHHEESGNTLLTPTLQILIVDEVLLQCSLLQAR